MKKWGVLMFFVASLIGYYRMSTRQLSPDVQMKERLLAAELRRVGLRPNYLPISGFRPDWLNRLLPLAAKKSAHRHGKAIDILVFDINGDWRINKKDVMLVVAAIERLDQREKKLKGGLGTYFHSAPWMVHFDTNGSKRRWNY